MRQALRLHPESRCAAVTEIEVEALRPDPGQLLLRYVVAGKISDLVLPAPSPSTRSDGLWRRSCFEAFVRAAPGSAYYEFNFAPSTQWAAYRFSDYREGMAVASEIGAPRIEIRSTDTNFELRTALALESLPSLPGDALWRLGLSAVIEEAGGRKSYWALAHPPGKADFHHSDCFACTLPVAEHP